MGGKKVAVEMATEMRKRFDISLERRPGKSFGARVIRLLGDFLCVAPCRIMRTNETKPKKIQRISRNNQVGRIMA